jgi:hypothetical protein
MARGRQFRAVSEPTENIEERLNFQLTTLNVTTHGLASSASFACALPPSINSAARVSAVVRTRPATNNVALWY